MNLKQGQWKALQQIAECKVQFDGFTRDTGKLFDLGLIEVVKRGDKRIYVLQAAGAKALGKGE